MADTSKTQSFSNHAKIVPLFHYFVLPVMLVNIVWAGYNVAPFSADSVIGLLVALALAAVAVFARVFALKAQDRVIRLEMRLRMRELLPADMHARIGDFSAQQMVALRFASDAELPALAASVLRDDMQDQKAIKKMVTNWQADHTRV